jgi:hypothetical protein
MQLAQVAQVAQLYQQTPYLRSLRPAPVKNEVKGAVTPTVGATDAGVRLEPVVGLKRLRLVLAVGLGLGLDTVTVLVALAGLGLGLALGLGGGLGLALGLGLEVGLGLGEELVLVLLPAGGGDPCPDEEDWVTFTTQLDGTYAERHLKLKFQHVVCRHDCV